MALPGTGIVNQGLQVTGGRTFGTIDNFAAVQSLSLDNSTQNFLATDTSLTTSRSAATQLFTQNFDATPTRSNQTITATTTIASANGNGFVISGFALHFAASSSVTLTSNTLFAGIADTTGGIQKTTNFSLQVTVTITFTDSTMPTPPTAGSGVVNQGLQIAGGRTFSTVDNFAAVQSMSFDSTTTGFLATDTTVSTSRGTPTSLYAQNFDATPTRNAQTISMTTTISTANAIFTINAVALHNATSTSVSATSTTLFAGLILSGGIAHTANFTLAITVTLTYNDNS